MNLTCGIDEAGRGPVIGPLVLAIAVLDEEGCDKLRELRVRDSKKIAVKRRNHLMPLVKKIAVEWNSIYIQPKDIDRLRKKMSLNLIEAYKTAELITGLKTKPDIIYVDATDSIAENYKKRILACIESVDPKAIVPKIIAEHRADDTYIEASAASIIAKVERDDYIEKLKEKHGDFGSGYPSDPTTKQFVDKLVREGNLPDYVRKSWGTIEKSKQSSLDDF